MQTRKIDSFLTGEVKVFGIKFTVIDLLFMAAVCVLAFFARWYLFPLKSGDYKGFLSRWMDKIQAMGAWNSLGVAISDYTSPYMYLMCLVSGFENDLTALKLVSVFFDYVGSVAMFLLVRQLTGDTRKGLMGMALTLLCPTVIINSGWWCQCDMIYCSFMVFAMYFLVKDNSRAACIMLGVAFSFKVQAVFLLPLLIILWLKNSTVKLQHLLYIPLVYVIMQVPAWIAGRPFSELMGVYLAQAGHYTQGTLKFPNIYELLDETYKHKHYMAEISGMGLCASIASLGVLAWYVYSRKFKMNSTIILTLALFSVSLALYTLPHMHERYGFIVDLLAIAYAVQRPGKFPVAILYIAISMLTYLPFLLGVYVFPFPVLAVVMLALDCYVGYDLVKQINEASEPQQIAKKL